MNTRIKTGVSELEYGGETLLVHWRFDKGLEQTLTDPSEPDEVEITQVQLQHTRADSDDPQKTSVIETFYIEILDMLEALDCVDTIIDELRGRGEFDDLDAGDPEPPDDFEDSAGYSRERLDDDTGSGFNASYEEGFTRSRVVDEDGGPL